MLHVVQVVRWGVAEEPEIHRDEAKAQASYVEQAEKHWEQRYAAYCEHHGLPRQAFASAQAFVKSIDASEKSTVNLWPIPFQEPGEQSCSSPGPEQEEARRLAKEMLAVKLGMARLLEDVSKLSDGLAGTAAEPVEVEPVEVEPVEVEPVEAEPVALSLEAAPSPTPGPRENPESDPAKYSTKEWSIFVAEIRRLCCGSRNEASLLPRGAWRDDVYSNATSLEYWDWVADRMERCKQCAEAAGYTVLAAPDSPGCHRFANREGDCSEQCYDSPWEAWCAAGLYLEESRKVVLP